MIIVINMKIHLYQSILAIFFFSSVFSQINDEMLQNSAPIRNFTYVKGEKEWTKHIPTEITSTFEELIDNNVYIKRLVCLGDSADLEKTPFHKIEQFCMQGHGAKMVVPLGYPTWSYEIILSPPTGGLFEQKHMMERIPIPLHFYDSSAKFKTKFFLLPFEDYEVPVYSLEEPKTFFPMWKRLFVTENQMEESYFDSHIRVIGCYIREMRWNSIRCQYFTVVYCFYLDWATMRLEDGFTISYDTLKLKNMLDTLEYERSFNSFGEKLPEDFIGYMRKQITSLKLIDSVVSKDHVVKSVTIASDLLSFDVNKDIKLNYRGELILKLWGTVDYKANKCICAEISLVDGKISATSECACFVY